MVALRSSYGHSMIVDPWGSVLAQCGDGEGVAVAPISKDYLNSIRGSMPVEQHRRRDLYHVAAVGDGEEGKTEAQEKFTFGSSGAVIHGWVCKCLNFLMLLVLDDMP